VCSSDLYVSDLEITHIVKFEMKAVSGSWTRKESSCDILASLRTTLEIRVLEYLATITESITNCW